MRKLIMLIISILLLSFCSCSNTNKLPITYDYVYDLLDVSSIQLKVSHLELTINENEYVDNLTFKSNYDFGVSKDNDIYSCVSFLKDPIYIEIYTPIGFTNKINISIISDYVLLNFKNVTLESINVDSNLLYYDFYNIKLSNLIIKNSYSHNFVNKILESNIRNLSMTSEKCHPQISNCTFETINITNNYGYTEFLKNSFSELNYNSINGKIFMELDPDYGYTFDYNIKSYWSAFEPDQSNPGYYLYGDGERKVNVDAPKGDMEIVKYR